MILTHIMTKNANMDILTMNERWIEDSHDNAKCCREVVLNCGSVGLEKFECLDIVGLFETSWMIYQCHEGENKYGYPR